jgi:micrococcal nuclease
MQTPNRLYHYQAHITAVYDGDTVTADVDLGLHIWTRGEKLRLHRINAPEVRGEQRTAGLLSRDFLREQVLDKDVVIETIADKKGKYGRYLAEIWLENAAGEWANINDLLVQSGHAEYHDY